ncbi:MAG: NUDIX hydrolase [Bacteroidia bacterium]|nr:NUDIX hydrolase [Bacteroidia bacterium]
MSIPESRLLFQHPLVSVEERLETGGEKRLIVHRGAFVAVCLALRTKEGEEYFLVLHQYRTAASEALYEHPAGMIDAGETPIEAALRELAEETGWLLTEEDLHALASHSFYPSPAIWKEEGYFFAARLTVPKAVLDAYLTYASREMKGERLQLTILSAKELLKRTRNLQTFAHTCLYHAYLSASDGKLPSPSD